MVDKMSQKSSLWFAPLLLPFLLNPLEIILTRRQIQHSDVTQTKTLNTLFKEMLVRDRMKMFTRGIVWGTLYNTCVCQGLLFTTYEENPIYLAGTLFLVHPFIVVQRNVQYYGGSGLQNIKQIYRRHGAGGFMRGTYPQVTLMLVSCIWMQLKVLRMRQIRSKQF